jgi:hypothetical protein
MRCPPQGLAEPLEFAFAVRIVGHVGMIFVSKPTIGFLDIVRGGAVLDA